MSSFRHWVSDDLAIDLGTATTLIYARAKGVVLAEPSVVAVRREGRGHNRFLAVGARAKEMVGRTPANVTAIRPLREGVIADFDATTVMLQHFIALVRRRRLFSPRIVIGIPAGVTAIERRSVAEAAESAGARRVYIVEQPLLAAIGADLPVSDAAGCMVVDIGGGTTNVAVIALGGIVEKASIKVGGDKMDEAIMAYIKRVHNLLVGERTAEAVKIEIGSAWATGDDGTFEVRGLDLQQGIPRAATLTSEEVRRALAEPVNAIVGAVRRVLDDVNVGPELHADIRDRGIILAGGGAQLKGIAARLREETGLPVAPADDPQTAVVRGAGRLLEDELLLERVMVGQQAGAG